MVEPNAIEVVRALAREVNRQIERVARRFESAEGDFLCECGRADCSQRLRLTLEEYGAIRDAGWFFAVPGHEHQTLDRIVERTDRYVIGEPISA